jgi:hypothetical protein
MRQVLRRWAVFAAALVCLVLGLAVPVMVGVELGVMALVLGLALAILPVPLYVTMVLWIDRFEAEPPGLLGLSFFLGATASVFTAAVANTSIAGWAGDDPALQVWVVASGPVVGVGAGPPGAAAAGALGAARAELAVGLEGLAGALAHDGVAAVAAVRAVRVLGAGRPQGEGARGREDLPGDLRAGGGLRLGPLPHGDEGLRAVILGLVEVLGLEPDRLELLVP